MATKFIAIKHKDGKRTAVVAEGAFNLVWKGKGWSKANKEEAAKIEATTGTATS